MIRPFAWVLTFGILIGTFSSIYVAGPLLLAPAIAGHPGGDLRTVWEVMKSEAPPWEHVIPMAQRYVDMMSAWLKGPGAHIVILSGEGYSLLWEPGKPRTRIDWRPARSVIPPFEIT